MAKTKSSASVNMQIGLEVIRSYRRLDYTPWYALAEFVDNSTQSYRDNKEALNATYEKERSQLRVVISYDRDADILVIRDNAMGMSLAQLRRALQIGRAPSSTAGRSQFGLGLKTAACWFGDQWSVKTKKLGETRAHFIVVDVEKVAAGRRKLPYKALKAAAAEHYTEIRIEKLHLKLQSSKLGKTKDSLKSMFRVDIREKELLLIWNNTNLNWSDDVQLLKKDDGTGEEFQPIGFDVGGRRVHGWVGVLASGSSGRARAGFAIIRRGRLIRGWPEAWKPEIIFGGGTGRNDLINQRITGEIHLDAFDVTHTKDDINWQADEEVQVQEGIKKAIPDIINRARHYRRPEEATKAVTLPPPDVWKLAIDAVIENTDFGARARAAGNVLSSAVKKAIPSDIADLVLKEIIDAVEHAPGLVRIKVGDAVIRVNVSAKLGADAPYMAISEGRGGVWIVAINAIHPSCALPEDIESLRIHLQHSLADGLVLWAARTGKISGEPASYLFLKDAILRYMGGGLV